MSRAPEVLRAEIVLPWAENNRLRASRAEDDGLRSLITPTKGSLSCRVTAPLRPAKTLYVKVRGRLDELGG